MTDETQAVGAGGRAGEAARVERLYLSTAEVLDLPHFTPAHALVFDGTSGGPTFTSSMGTVTIDLTDLLRRVEELERRLADLAAPATDAERAMAHAVLRGDRVAALALADRVQEDHAGG